ncbi:hypothetical protein C8R43DRAFT_1191405 [Mycena crocata]|nr:hypothetical protein C8R43DRAFT_1191405 [Mycena crocata]
MNPSTNIYCGQCDLTFVDVQARLEHIGSSSFHPFCKTCKRRFLNDNALTYHLKCAAPHVTPIQVAEEEMLDGDEILLNWTSAHDASISYLNISENDYWSSSESDSDSSSLISESGSELVSDSENFEHQNDVIILLARTEPASEYRDLLFENLVNSSEISAPFHWCVVCPWDLRR